VVKLVGGGTMANTYVMNPEIMDLLNTQINVELKNERVYKQFAALLDVANWPGTKARMEKYSDEERSHADKFLNWVITNFGTPKIEAQESVSGIADGENLTAFWEGALKLEHENTLRINALYKSAFDAQEWATCNFLGFFLDDQIEGEREISDILLSLGRMTVGEQVLWDKDLGG
jgi:ferritin